VSFYCVAEEVGAANLLEYCSSLISIHWDELLPQDFIHMSGALLYKMLKAKTKNPLHSAVRIRREDVVFLCLVEHEGTVSQKKLYIQIIFFIFTRSCDFESSRVST
jgi:rabankyrin-5